MHLRTSCTDACCVLADGVPDYVVKNTFEKFYGHRASFNVSGDGKTYKIEAESRPEIGGPVRFEVTLETTSTPATPEIIEAFTKAVDKADSHEEPCPYCERDDTIMVCLEGGQGLYDPEEPLIDAFAVECRYCGEVLHIESVVPPSEGDPETEWKGEENNHAES